MLKVIISAALLFISGACAQTQQAHFYYRCVAEINNEDGRFSVSDGDVSWVYHPEPGVTVRAHLSGGVLGSSADIFLVEGFARVRYVAFGFDPGPDPVAWPEANTRALEVRVGTDRQRQSIGPSNVVVFSYSSWNAVAEAENGLNYTLYAAPHETVLARAAIPHERLARVEPTLRRLAAELTEMRADILNRCARVSDEGVVVT